jgi:drug/metabolite transporter (DMT)-like permease
MNSQRNERRGELYALLLSILEGFFPIFSMLAIAHLGAIYSYFYTLLLATPLLLLIQWQRGLTHELFNKAALRDLLLTTLFITLLFLAVFIGLRYTTPSNAAVIMILQLFFSYFYFNILGNARMTSLHTFGAVLMGIGAIIILMPYPYHFNWGDLIIFFGAAIAPLANLYQQRARLHVASVSILTFRNLMALPVLFIMAIIFEPFVNPFNAMMPLLYIALNAVLIFVISKILWVEALHHISITKLSAMVAFIPIFTLIFSYFILGILPGIKEMGGSVLILLGALWITR